MSAPIIGATPSSARSTRPQVLGSWRVTPRTRAGRSPSLRSTGQPWRFAARRRPDSRRSRAASVAASVRFFEIEGRPPKRGRLTGSPLPSSNRSRSPGGSSSGSTARIVSTFSKSTRPELIFPNIRPLPVDWQPTIVARHNRLVIGARWREARWLEEVILDPLSFCRERCLLSALTVRGAEWRGREGRGGTQNLR